MDFQVAQCTTTTTNITPGGEVLKHVLNEIRRHSHGCNHDGPQAEVCTKALKGYMEEVPSSYESR